MRNLIVLMLISLVLAGCGYTEPEETMDPASTEESNESAAMTQTTETPTEIPLLRELIDPKSSDFVRVADYVPGIVVDLKYTGTDNFTGQDIYEFDDAFLRYGTVKKLKAVGEELAEQGLYLKIWDSFRPVAAQFRLWEICPDDTYVADPNKGYSNHSRGFAVDLTLVDSDGNELLMPTGFDDFSAMADRDYSDCTAEAAGNAQLLQCVMEKHGFTGYYGEWWHFNDNQKYEVETCFDPAAICHRRLKEDALLLERHWVDGSDILTVPAGETVTLLGFDEEYAMIEYWGYRGYILSAQLQET